ncbi:MAG: hypothetical protein LBD32_02615 [Cytophagales bacterium]|jgi:hypothetical protein|nr:hypothetical protein [Cytophagales bacterium]
MKKYYNCKFLIPLACLVVPSSCNGSKKDKVKANLAEVKAELTSAEAKDGRRKRG